MNNTINRYLAILCYPLTSLNFFYKDYFAEMLNIKQSGDKKPGNKKIIGLENELKKKVIEEIQNKYVIHSYDEIYMYLEKCYLYDFRLDGYEKPIDFYLKILNRLADSMISQRDGKIIYKYWKNQNDKSFLEGFGDNNKIFLFHSLNSHLSLDMVVLFYIARNENNDIRSLNNYYGQIEIADQQLEQIFKSGVSENQLHAGTALSFLNIWDFFMKPLQQNMIKSIQTASLGLGKNGNDENEILFYVLVAALVRVYIAVEIGKASNARAKILEEEETDNRKELDKVYRIISLFENGKDLKDEYRKCFGEFSNKEKILNHMLEVWDTYRANILGIAPDESLIRQIFDIPANINTSDENIFLFQVMRYFICEEGTIKGKQSEYLFQLFLQYIRIKNYMFGCIVQKKTIVGLDYFQKEFYSSDSSLNSLTGAFANVQDMVDNSERMWKEFIRIQFQNRYLKKIEFRTTIADKESTFRRKIKNFLSAYLHVIQEDYCICIGGKYEVQREFPQVGLIFPLLKRKDDTIPEKCIMDGLDNPDRIQYGKVAKRYEEQVKIMRRLRDQIPGLEKYIVGLDAASLENATPVWVFMNAFEHARDSLIEKVQYGNGGNVQSIRFTFHAGEDFRHILSGLRRMDEVVTFLKFHAGDRLGHGTALGVNPEYWRRENPFVVLPRMEALENYVWAYYVLSNESMDFQSNLMAYIERRCTELADEIYGKAHGIDMHMLIEGYVGLFQKWDEQNSLYQTCKSLRENGFCEEVQENKCNKISWSGEKLIHARHCKAFLKEMERPIHYEVTDQDIMITKTLQTILKKKISRNGIVVEVNPSSNVAIGEMDKLNEHQIYELNKPGQLDNIMVCINSDDPTIFNTNVTNELSYIYYGMLNNGMSREAALAWIDKVRMCGMNASFIQQESNMQMIYNDLEEIVARL